ncbi:hypothetical protein JDF658_24960, partial [Carboxydocella sp. JDF658]
RAPQSVRSANGRYSPTPAREYHSLDTTKRAELVLI